MFQFSCPVLVVWGCIGPKLQELSRMWLFCTCFLILYILTFPYAIKSGCENSSHRFAFAILQDIHRKLSVFLHKRQLDQQCHQPPAGCPTTSPAVGCPWIHTFDEVLQLGCHWLPWEAIPAIHAIHALVFVVPSHMCPMSSSTIFRRRIRPSASVSIEVGSWAIILHDGEVKCTRSHGYSFEIRLKFYPFKIPINAWGDWG